MDGYAFAASGLMPVTIDFDIRPLAASPARSARHHRITTESRASGAENPRYRDQVFVNASENAVHRKLGIVKIPGRSLGRSVSKSTGVVVLGAL